MSKKADHADLIERLLYPDDSIAVRLEAATVLEWQAKEIRHLAHRVFELEAEIKKAKELPGGFEWKRVENRANRK